MIKKSYKANFATLKTAFANGHVCLMECTDVATKKPVITICAVSWDSDTKTYSMSPFAKMFDGNPYNELEPPK